MGFVLEASTTLAIRHRMIWRVDKKSILRPETVAASPLGTVVECLQRGACAPVADRLYEILQAEIRMCLAPLGVIYYDQLNKSKIRPARRVVRADAHSAFPHRNLSRATS